MFVSVQSLPGRFRFGKFELDPTSGELHQNGHKIALAPKVFELLRALLDRPGQVVTREELRAKLWAADTFVEFDDSLNHTVKKLREALGDDACNPVYVETLPRRGYRFIGSVTPLKSTNGDPQSIAVSEMAEESTTRHESERQAAADVRKLNCDVAAVSAIFQSGSRVAGLQTFASHRWVWTTALLIASAIGMFWWRRPMAPPRIVGTRQLTHDSALKQSLLTDGNRIYFLERFWQSARIAQVAVKGGEVSVINTGTSLPDLGAISPDGSELLGTISTDNTQEQICAFSSLTGSHRRIGDLIGHDPAWAPDGRLFFSRGNDIWVAEHDGRSPRKLFATSGVPWGYQFSPDGNRFSFGIFNPTTFALKLWTAGLDGTGLQEILPGRSEAPAECCASWTSDGRYLVFVTRQNNASSLWIAPQKARFGGALSGEPIQLTTGPLWINGVLPARDGKQIFIVGTQPKGELVQVDTKTGRFVPILGGIFASGADYSRDDLWITYVLHPEQTLWRSRADGSERLQLTFPPMQAILPHWSPDGRRIAFVASMPGHPWHIFVMHKDGGVPQAISSSEESQTDPSWSKDGRTIAFSHNTEIAFSHPVLKADKSFIGMFDVNSGAIARLAGSDGMLAPRWSPDGRYVAALAEDNRVLTLYDTQSRKWKTLLRRQTPVGFVTWSHDGTAIYFDTLLTDQPTIYRVRVRDAKLDPILNLNSYHLYPNLWSGLGSWGGLAPGDVPLLVRDISTSEIFAFDLDFHNSSHSWR